VAPFTHSREVPHDYPATRDSYGVLLGLVQPGDVLDLPEAPDLYWQPYEGEGVSPAPEPPVSPETAPQTSEAGETGSEEN
jgi:hypothetical protein